MNLQGSFIGLEEFTAQSFSPAESLGREHTSAAFCIMSLYPRVLGNCCPDLSVLTLTLSLYLFIGAAHVPHTCSEVSPQQQTPTRPFCNECCELIVFWPRGFPAVLHGKHTGMKTSPQFVLFNLKDSVWS